MSEATDGQPTDIDQYLSLNRQTYERDFLPVYTTLRIKPRKLVQFPAILPFHLPFKDGLCVTFALEQSDACTLTFGSLSTVEHVHAGLVSEKPITVPRHQSRIEMTYVMGTDAVMHTDEATLSTLFDTMLSKLNSIIVAYMVLTKDYRVYRISREMLEFGSVFRVIDPADWTKAENGLFLLHRDVPFEKPQLSEESHFQVVWYARVIDGSLNPFTLNEELWLTAQREFLAGFYREAVVLVQTSIETLLGALLAHAMTSEGRSHSDIEQLMDQTGFASRVKRQYHTRFGGEWNVDKRETIIGEWYALTYLLRNRIVHSGYNPNFPETSAALEAAREMVNYVVSLVRSKKKEYPKLQEFLEPSPVKGAT